MKIIRPTQIQQFLLIKSSITLVALLLFNGCAMSNPFVPSSTYAYNTAPVCTIPSTPITSKPMYRATMRPYTVGGVTYCPTTVAVGEKFEGTASWYGPNFHGGQTSNGEYYNMYAYTAAHKTLPINTKVKVTNLQNHLSTIVRINDRGPFVKNRIIDLSYSAAKDIGLIKSGTAHVRLEVLSFDTQANQYAHILHKKEPKLKKNPQILPLDNLYIQVASFSDEQKALLFKRKCYTLDSKHQPAIKTKKIANQTIYSVLIGKFYSILEAKNYIQHYAYNGAFIVRD